MFDCIAAKDNSIYEKNIRLFNTKNGAYISIKKKNNSKIKYTINQITGHDIVKQHKFKKFKSWDSQKIFPYKQKLYEDFGFDDWIILPRVMWGDPTHPSTYWKHPNNPEGSMVLVETFESVYSNDDKMIARAHICKENKNEKT